MPVSERRWWVTVTQDGPCDNVYDTEEQARFDAATYEYEVVEVEPSSTRGAVDPEVERLRWALEEACDSAWTDGPAAMAQLLRRYDQRVLDEEEAG